LKKLTIKIIVIVTSPIHNMTKSSKLSARFSLLHLDDGPPLPAGSRLVTHAVTPFPGRAQVMRKRPWMWPIHCCAICCCYSLVQMEIRPSAHPWYISSEIWRNSRARNLAAFVHPGSRQSARANCSIVFPAG